MGLLGVVGCMVAVLSVGSFACGNDSGSGNRDRQGERAQACTVDRNRRAIAPPAVFASLPVGWQQFTDGGARLTSRGGISEAFATSWRCKQSSPHGPAGDMPPGGIIVDVLLIRRAVGGRRSAALCRGVGPYPRYPHIRRRPLRLIDAAVGVLEGYPHVPEYRLFRTVREEYNVELRVAVNRASPDRALLREAQTVLDRLQLPHWPTRC